jgi:uncharacterized membrane protein HdeD (DUF308 family)
MIETIVFAVLTQPVADLNGTFPKTVDALTLVLTMVGVATIVAAVTRIVCALTDRPDPPLITEYMAIFGLIAGLLAVAFLKVFG